MDGAVGASPAITGYRITRGPQSGTRTELVADTGTTATAYTDHTAQGGTSYTYGVQAINTDGTGTAATANVTTPAVPDNVLANTPGPGQHATDTSGAVRYQAFSTGPNLSGYLLASVRLSISNVQNSAARVDVLADERGQPGAVLYELTHQGERDYQSASGSNQTFFDAPDGAVLHGSGHYWIRVQSTGTADLVLRTTPAGTTSSVNRTSGWSADGGMRKHYRVADFDPGAPGSGIARFNNVMLDVNEFGDPVFTRAHPAGRAMWLIMSGEARPVPAGSEPAGTDLPTDASTTGAVSVGGTVYGTLTVADDRPPTDDDIAMCARSGACTRADYRKGDWFRVDGMACNRRYRIEAEFGHGGHMGGGIQLWDSSWGARGDVHDSNHDGTTAMEFECEHDWMMPDTHWVHVTAENGVVSMGGVPGAQMNYFGPYSLTVADITAETAPTLMVSNLGSSVAPGQDIYAVAGNVQLDDGTRPGNVLTRAVRFTTGAHTAGYTLDSIEVDIRMGRTVASVPIYDYVIHPPTVEPQYANALDRITTIGSVSGSDDDELTLVSNLDETLAVTRDTNWHPGQGEFTHCFGQSFTTGDHPHGYRLSSLELAAGGAGGGTRTQVGIVADNNGSPDITRLETTTSSRRPRSTGIPRARR